MIQKIYFGRRIAQYHRQREWSQAELAEKLGVTSQAVSKWERGTALPDVELLLELSHLYGVSINEMLEDRNILKSLTDQEYRMGGAAIFDSGVELFPEWAGGYDCGRMDRQELAGSKREGRGVRA